MDITATSLYRVIECNGSVALAGQVPASDNTQQSEDAREGIAAHFLATAVLSGVVADPFEYIDRMSPGGIFITAEMCDHVDIYTSAIFARDGIDVDRSVETTCDFQYGPNGWVRARADHIRFDNVTLYVDDFKYGWRIVEPERNWTMIAYAIGYILRHNIMPRDILFTIGQPRPHHPDGKIREWRISFAELIELYDRLKSSLASLTDIGTSTLKTGPYCHDCPARAYCPALRAASMSAIDVIAETVVAEELSDADVSYELTIIDQAMQRLEDRRNALAEMATHRIFKGQVVPDYVLEPRFGHTAWNKGLTPELVTAMTGVNVASPKFITPNQAKKKGIPEPVLATMTYRPPLDPKLVRRDADRHARKHLKG